MALKVNFSDFLSGLLQLDGGVGCCNWKGGNVSDFLSGFVGGLGCLFKLDGAMVGG